MDSNGFDVFQFSRHRRFPNEAIIELNQQGVDGLFLIFCILYLVCSALYDKEEPLELLHQGSLKPWCLYYLFCMLFVHQFQ
jgi:hypothetical protein|mmetsp:Transcript_27861/g.44651  ORF Transcript_27861/g.44651 Transcript_27861/m.44651 type:complete len:81 (+) Transcript_27861:824-1066(+)